MRGSQPVHLQSYLTRLLLIQQQNLHRTLLATGPHQFNRGVETGVSGSTVLVRPSTRNPMPVRRSGFRGPDGRRITSTGGE
jgi:hypothetical protein